MKTKLLMIVAGVVVLAGFIAYDWTLYPIAFAKDVNTYDGQKITQIGVKNMINEPSDMIVLLYEGGSELEIDMGTLIRDEKSVKEIETLLKTKYLVKKTLKPRGGKIDYVIRLLNDKGKIADVYYLTEKDTIIVPELAALGNSFGAYQSESIMNQKKKIKEMKSILKDYE